MASGREEILLEVVRAERPLEDCELGGVRRTYTASGLTIEPLGDPVTIILRLEDIAQGLVALADRFADLSEWAQFVLGSAGIVDFEDAFESTKDGDRLLVGIWDAAFGSRPSGESLDAARRVLEKRCS